MHSGFWNRRSIRGKCLIAALAATTLYSGFMLARNVWAAEPNQRTQAARAQAVRPIPASAVAPLADLESAFIAIGERMEPSVVSIRVTKNVRTAGLDQFGPMLRQFPGFGGDDSSPLFRSMPRTYKMQGSGSGVIVREDGWILTNDHVVGGADKVTVKLSDGREMQGTVRRDYRSDLALVKINASNLQPADLGNSDKVRVGQWAIAFGSPFALDKTMTHGIISARARQQDIGGRGDFRSYTNLLQTDAPINPGNSGGPLVNIHGQVIGINVAIESPSGGSVGIGFAIPSNTARDIMEQLITRGKVVRGFLGVLPRSMTFEERQKEGIANGALIQSVTDGTPAAKAGLQPGDIVVRINGRPIADDAALRDAVAREAPGGKLEMTVRRNGRERTITATVGEAPDPLKAADAAPQQAQPASGKLGVRVESLTADSAKQFNVDGVTSGAVIAEVLQGSPAEDAGLQAGDVVVRANGRPVNTAQDLTAAVQAAKAGDTVNLVIYRNKARTLVGVKLQ